ncbi:RluA family pseudouridine synthase [Desulfotalea psychrophila]|uniref:Related to ribosomal large subunit pseudouridine synthase D n=1 Tax=Desulfotalea psychrophila (strain LSv54 / DSM 12343) TaxID=177439 RepID=Q6AJJ4_DESPS|nr:RNA pseudouridine synthase [Desulfotalea psychrophila]CAG37486.1 related to ribosomal large subunit pseudouridine synthase D [Desulfotalea psychrophila LSv54]
METNKKFKAPPKKYQPRGLPIVYEDNDIILVDKVAGLATTSRDKDNENTAYFRLTNYVKKGVAKSSNRVFLIHHVDKEASGLLIFAKTEKARRHLLDNWSDFNVSYVAAVHGVPVQTEGVLRANLAENMIHKMYVTVAGEKTRPAETEYSLLQHSANYSLLSLRPKTEVKHQVRVQLADKGHSIIADKIYGVKSDEMKRLALHAAHLTITHPHTKKEMSFESRVPGHFYALTAALKKA